MKILVIGSGGREHAIVQALTRRASCSAVFASPGSDGIAQHATCVALTGHAAIIAFCKTEGIGLVVIGPEQPLVDGLADALREAGIATFGPSAKAAQIEASKDFTKKLCDRMGIPTARYATFDTAAGALEYLATHGAPVVVKADGLAAGKGVTVAMDMATATRAITECFEGAFGAAGSRVVLEEMMVGEEVSFFALCDGKRTAAFAFAQDHKRAFDGDTGPNTGGMGAYSPAPIFTPAMQQEVMARMIEPAMRGLQEMDMPYIGVFFAGLMLTPEGPKLIEFNARFGDPETQAMLARFTGDFAALLYSCAIGELDTGHMQFSNDAAMVVVMAARGYPGDYQKGTPIAGLENAATHASILHAGTKFVDGQWQAHGGRVLGIVGAAPTLQEAQKKAYAAIAEIHWPEGFCRSDIGQRELQRK